MTAQAQTRSARRVAATKGAAVKDNVVASRFVNAYLEGSKAVEDAKAGLAGAKTSALDIVRKALVGCEAISEALWDRTWKEPVAKALAASGRYHEKSIPPKVAALKVVVMGLTNGVAVADGDTIKSYEDKARQQLAKRGLYEAKKQGAKRQDAGAKEAKAAQASFVEACNVVSLHNDAMARNLALVMADPEGREELATLVAEIAEEIAKRNAEEEAPKSRRRKAA